MKVSNSPGQFVSQHVIDKLSPYENLMGTMSDEEVGDVAEVSKQTIQRYRSLRGIPACKVRRKPKRPMTEASFLRIDKMNRKNNRLLAKWRTGLEASQDMRDMQARQKGRRLLSYAQKGLSAS